MLLKDKARQYFTAVSNYDSEVVEKMVHENYIQHNPFVPTGRAAFLALLPTLKKYGARIENQRMFEDDSHVIMHHLWKNATPMGAEEMVAFHIVRFDAQGLIAEHWSALTEFEPSNSPNATMINGETQVRNLDDTQRNKSQVLELMGHHLVGDELEKFIPEYYLDDCKLHHPLMEEGAAGYIALRSKEEFKLKYLKCHKIFGEGHFVLSISEGIYQGKRSAIYDLYRLRDSKIAEHWVVIQSIPTENLANDNTLFNFK